MPQPFAVGDVYYQAGGSLFGREEIIGEPCATQVDAENTAASWLSSLSGRESKSATAWVNSFRVVAVGDAGEIEHAESFGEATPVE